jgi:RNAse (barnase) inhibitor barstar
MTQLDGFYSELAAALQFPDYFGENPAAVAECLTDLSWMPADAYLLVVVDHEVA